MIAYKTDELVGITELSKSLGTYLDKVTANAFNKLAIVRRNKPEAVIIPIKEYEHMRAAANYIEDMAILNTIQTRMPNGNFQGGFDFEKYHKERIERKDNVSS